MSCHSGYRVPYTITEWNRVRLLFKSSRMHELRECLAILSMWRSRMGDSTPVAISCSDLLVRVAIEELLIESSDEKWMKIEALKMQHCIAIIRFINYVNEICQKERQLVSIVKAVKQLGIPSWVVEIRHNASHSHVPPIGTLRKAFEYSRQWLWDNFWVRPPDEAMRTAGVLGRQGDLANDLLALEKEEKIQGAIIQFIRWRTANPLAEAFIIDKIPPLAEIQRLIMQEPFDFLRSFVSEGMLVMTRDQLRYAGINPQTDGWTIPKNVQIFWEPVFSMVYENKVIGELLINLITRLGENIETASDSVTQLVCWTKMMLEPCLSSDIDIFSTAEWSRILHRMVAAPGHFDVTLIEAVMQKVPNMDKKRRKQVRRIMDISMSESLMVVEDSMNVRTIEDLQNLIHKESQSSKEANGNEEDRFILCDMEEWCSVPIGLTPGQSLDSLSLIIDDDWLKEQGQLKPYGLVTIVEE